MASLTLKNASGKDAGSIDLDDDLFGVTPNVPLMHQVVTAQLAARRSGTQSTKTRSDVRGGGRKPYAQKGTGNARPRLDPSTALHRWWCCIGPKASQVQSKDTKEDD